VQEHAAGLFAMKTLSPPQFLPRIMGKAFPFLLIFSMAACTPQPPETVALQCITGAAEWNPIEVDLAHPQIGGNPATVTDSEIRWDSITRNGFGGATHTQYGINRHSGLVTVDNTYVDPRGIRALEPDRYAGECYARHRPF
jgi:hypothetical protein